MPSSHIESCLECEHHDIVADWRTDVEDDAHVVAVVCVLRKEDPVDVEGQFLGDRQPCKIVLPDCPEEALTDNNVGVPAWCPLGLISSGHARFVETIAKGKEDGSAKDQHH